MMGRPWTPPTIAHHSDREFCCCEFLQEHCSLYAWRNLGELPYPGAELCCISVREATICSWFKGSCVRAFCVNWFQFALCSALCILMFSTLFRSLWDIVLLSLENSYRNRESPFQNIWIFASFRNFCCLGIDCPDCLLLEDLEEEIKKNKVRNFVFSKAPALLWVGHSKGKRIVFILWERSTTVGRNTVTRPPHSGAFGTFLLAQKDYRAQGKLFRRRAWMSSPSRAMKRSLVLQWEHTEYS